MPANKMLADQKVEAAREKVREWGARMSRGQWDWHALGQALQSAHEAAEAAPSYQRPWTLLADIYHRVGKSGLAEKCLQRSYRLATPGPRFPGGFYREVQNNLRTGYPFDARGGLSRAGPPAWFEDKYQRYWTIIEAATRQNIADIAQVPTVFLSYAHENAAEANRLYGDLQAHGFAVWIDTKELQPGERWQQKILEAIANRDFIVLCLSSLGLSKTGFFQVELREALEQQKYRPLSQVYLIPVRLDDCPVPLELRPFQYVDLFRDWGSAVEQIAASVHLTHQARLTALRSRGA